MLGVTEDRARLWVDCQPIRSVQGPVECPLKKRGQYDTNGGYLSIAQQADTRGRYQVSWKKRQPIVGWLIFFFSSQSSPPVSISPLEGIFFLFTLDPVRDSSSFSAHAPQFGVIFPFFFLLRFLLLDWPAMDGYDLRSGQTCTSELWWDSRKLIEFISRPSRYWTIKVFLFSFSINQMLTRDTMLREWLLTLSKDRHRSPAKSVLEAHREWTAPS